MQSRSIEGCVAGMKPFPVRAAGSLKDFCEAMDTVPCARSYVAWEVFLNMSSNDRKV